jgi:hypothetical protein
MLLAIQVKSGKNKCTDLARAIGSRKVLESHIAKVKNNLFIVIILISVVCDI